MSSRPLKRILFVEDDHEIREIAQISMESLGHFEVIACASGAEALAAAPTAGADLILLDVMMPGMNGPSTLTALRQVEATALTPAIFMTARVQPAQVAEYLALGAIGVIHKPFDPMELSAEIAGIWEKRA